MLACSAFAVQASSSYSFEFLSASYEVDGTLTVADTQNALGSYDILGITGTVWGLGGGNITGLVNNPNQPNPMIDYGLGFMYDNVLPLNINGILGYMGDENAVFNLYMNNGVAVFDTNDANGPVGRVFATGTFTATLNNNVAPVPEPETYAMMLAGLGMLGLASRRRRQSLLATA